MMQLESADDFQVITNSPEPTPLAGLKIHPDFSSEDANVTLAAKESKMCFRVHSFTLKTTSGFFRTMFSLPQGSSEQSDIMYLEEDAEILEPLLRMICGMPFPDFTSVDLLENVIFAAEKYDMAGALSILRLCLVSPSLPEDPIQMYAIAKRQGWEEIAKTYSTRTLVLNIFDSAHQPALRTASSDAVLDLFMLHRARKDGLKQMLNTPPFVSGTPSNCIQCNGRIDYRTWRELKYRMLTEVDERPLGDTILDPGMSLWPEALECWKACCGNSGCKRLLYDKAETIRVIRGCLDKLPSST
ncbi:hypothetical protein CPB83DRAFT_854308 [Crepidotus variabilis]|uniref:BTB domain-containing protein n=1 Tax=Crepidotus variabilis TaxID=179855 RepID=A0A9P6EGK7_9AGAR|nr:hypothetical protein CPB83DRAFT_854308 [Crepidotus variabilis]